MNRVMVFLESRRIYVMKSQNRVHTKDEKAATNDHRIRKFEHWVAASESSCSHCTAFNEVNTDKLANVDIYTVLFWKISKETNYGPPAKSSKHGVRWFAIPINLNAVEHVTQAAEEHLGDTEKYHDHACLAQEDDPELLQVSRWDRYCLLSPVIQNLRTISSSGLAPKIRRSLYR